MRQKIKRSKNPLKIEAVPRFATQQMGSSIWTETANAYGEFLSNPNGRLLAEYEKAATTDDTVSFCIQFIKLAVIASLAEFQHPDPEIQHFVRNALYDMEGNHKTALGEMVYSGNWAGFACSEIVWRPENKFMTIERIVNYHPKSIELAIDRNGNLNEHGEPFMGFSKRPGVYQSLFGNSGVKTQLPLNKLCFVTHNKRHNNYYGEPDLKRVYINWLLKRPGIEMWATAIDRYGTPVIYMIVPNRETGATVYDQFAPGGTRPERVYDTAQEAVANLTTASALVLEHDGNIENSVKLGTLTTGNNYGDNFSQFLDYHNRAIMRGLLVPALLFSDGKGGMNSTAKVHFDVFKLVMTSIYEEFIDGFCDQVIGRLIRYNFNDNRTGTFPMKPFDAATSALLMEVISEAVSTGFVDPSRLEDLNHVRQVLNIPVTDKPIVSNWSQTTTDEKRKLDIARLKVAAPKLTSPNQKQKDR